MRSTCLGARSGRRAMTTLPFVVSMISVFSGSLMVAMWKLRCSSFPLPILHGERARVRGRGKCRVGVCCCPSPRPSPRKRGEGGSLLVRQQVYLLHHVRVRRRLALGDLVDVLHA